VTEETIVEIPCRIGELYTTGSIFVKIIIPRNGIAAFVPPSHLTILEQPLTGAGGGRWEEGGLRGKVRARLLGKDDRQMTVEIHDRGTGRIIDIPYGYFYKYSAEWDIPLRHFSPLIPLADMGGTARCVPGAIVAALEAVADAARAVHEAATKHKPFDVTGQALTVLGERLDTLDKRGAEAIEAEMLRWE